MKINWTIAFLAVAFWWEETAYFGWNALPQSPAEVICDGIAFLIWALALVKLPKVTVTVNNQTVVQP